jgi:hypothetical protein
MSDTTHLPDSHPARGRLKVFMAAADGSSDSIESASSVVPANRP